MTASYERDAVTATQTRSGFLRMVLGCCKFAFGKSAEDLTARAVVLGR